MSARTSIQPPSDPAHDRMSITAWASNRSIRRGFQWAVFALCLAMGSSSAQTVVNAYTTSAQGRSSVAADGQGRFIVVWASNGQDGDGTGIFGRRFDADGAPLGDDFAVNTYTTGDQSLPRVAANADGDFVVVWQGEAGASRDDVFGRRFDSAGMPIGGQFQINEDTSLSQEASAVAVADDGAFLVVWSNEDRLGARHFDSSGAPTTGDFDIAIDDVADPTGFRSFFEPRAETLLGGNFVIAWHDYLYPAAYFIGYHTVQAAVLDEDASPVAALDASSGSVEQKRVPALTSTPDGGFVVVWAAYTDYSQYSQLNGRRFSSAGTPQGAIFDPTPADETLLVRPEGVAMVDPDHFLVIWSHPPIKANDEITGRFVATDGTPLGKSFAINNDVVDEDRHAAVASAGSGDFMVTWTRLNGGAAGSDIVAKFGFVFSDSFETGDTSAWDATVSALSSD